MHQFLLDRALSPDRRTSRVFRLLASAMARVDDRVVRYRLNGRSLALPLSHDLPRNRLAFPTYSDNLRRLAAFLRRQTGSLRMIDVGANIGDSWALASESGRGSDAFLLIEGDPRWFALLERNVRLDPHATCVCALLSDHAGEAEAELIIEQGNGRIIEGGGRGRRVRYETLDGVVERHPAFRDAQLVKVDVEGFDARVLRGGARLLEAARPALLFEHQPRLIAASGDDDRALFHELAGRGYGRFILYDNRGFLIGTVSASESVRLDELLRYARIQSDCYYDVCAIHDGLADWRDAFLREELAFYAALER